MYKSASKNLQRRRAGDRWKYARPRKRRSPSANSSQQGITDPSPVSDFRRPSQLPPTSVRQVNSNSNSDSLEHTQCPTCQAWVTIKKLSKHRRKVHGEIGVRVFVDATTPRLTATPAEDTHIADREFLGAKINMFYVRGSKNRAKKASEALSRCGADTKLELVTKPTSQEHAEMIYFFPQAQGYERMAKRIAFALRQLG